jgi:hypothetical protein
MKKVLVLFLVIVIGGCASTNMTSFKDPAFQNVKFKRILVIANTSDLQWRQKLESRMVGAFNDGGIDAMQSIFLFPPTRNLSPEDKVNLLMQNNIDAYLSINVGESGVQNVYVPAIGKTVVEGNQVYEDPNKIVGGNYTLSKPWATFRTTLQDASSGSTAWVANSSTGGNAYASFNTVINSYCEKVVEQLRQDGLIAIPMRK